jgi:pimeloyl-ACP methyl ester carboxylesterase
MWATEGQPEHEGITGVTFDSDGHRLVGTFYLARGNEPKPTALLLHGCPGLEKNFDVAVTLRYRGWNALVFHYRGCWGSAGRYDLRTIPRDVTAAVGYLADSPLVDPGRIAVVGMWREALHMVAAGEATVEEIDASIAFGPGLRWALMGPCLTFHLAGGSGGMAHMLDHFGAALLEPWTRLQAPSLTPELRERMIEGCLREADGRSVAELERLRDGFLAELLVLVERYAVTGSAAPAPAGTAAPAIR